MCHIGILYRVPHILDIINKNNLRESEIFANFPRSFRDVDTKQLLEVISLAGFICTKNDGRLALTISGKKILNTISPVDLLRKEIRCILDVTNPIWGAFMVQGRRAFAEYAPAEVVQCFREAGILDSLEEDILSWWDQIASRYRNEEETSRKNQIGRKGERLSFEYELKRTGRIPYWISLEYEGAGYDIKSIISQSIDEPLLIEVKASSQPWEKAKLYLTRHEWIVLSRANHAIVHLWSIYDDRLEFSTINISQLSRHIPLERENGEWELFTCPFSAFEPSRNG